jgi:hypothetical protein
MLADMGWKVAPTPLKLPLLRRSERRVPAWVLSSMILVRLQALLDSLTRRFESTTELRTAPRGRVDWADYAQGQIPRGQFVAVPCTYPDLRDDRILKGAIATAAVNIRAPHPWPESRSPSGMHWNVAGCRMTGLFCAPSPNCHASSQRVDRHAEG